MPVPRSSRRVRKPLGMTPQPAGISADGHAGRAESVPRGHERSDRHAFRGRVDLPRGARAARSTVFVLTPRTAARSFVGGGRRGRGRTAHRPFGGRSLLRVTLASRHLRDERGWHRHALGRSWSRSPSGRRTARRSPFAGMATEAVHADGTHLAALPPVVGAGSAGRPTASELPSPEVPATCRTGDVFVARADGTGRARLRHQHSTRYFLPLWRHGTASTETG